MNTTQTIYISLLQVLWWYEITECWRHFHKYSTKRGVRKFQACPKQGWLMGGAAVDVEQIYDNYKFYLIDQLISFK